MVYNALEIETTGAFSPCCITTKQYRNDDGEKFNVATDSISTVILLFADFVPVRT